MKWSHAPQNLYQLYSFIVSSNTLNHTGLVVFCFQMHNTAEIFFHLILILNPSYRQSWLYHMSLPHSSVTQGGMIYVVSILAPGFQYQSMTQLNGTLSLHSLTKQARGSKLADWIKYPRSAKILFQFTLNSFFKWFHNSWVLILHTH